MGMGFAPTWLRQVSPPLLHMTTLTTVVGWSFTMLSAQTGYIMQEMYHIGPGENTNIMQ